MCTVCLLCTPSLRLLRFLQFVFALLSFALSGSSKIFVEPEPQLGMGMGLVVGAVATILVGGLALTLVSHVLPYPACPCTRINILTLSILFSPPHSL